MPIDFNSRQCRILIVSNSYVIWLVWQKLGNSDVIAGPDVDSLSEKRYWHHPLKLDASKVFISERFVVFFLFVRLYLAMSWLVGHYKPLK